MKKVLLILWLCSVYIGFSQTSFGPKQTISNNTGVNPQVIASGQLDNDSYNDVVIGTWSSNTIEWYRNNGDGTFSSKFIISSSFSTITSLSVVDFDKDNAHFLSIRNSETSQFTVGYEPEFTL